MRRRAHGGSVRLDVYTVADARSAGERCSAAQRAKLELRMTGRVPALPTWIAVLGEDGPIARDQHRSKGFIARVERLFSPARRTVANESARLCEPSRPPLVWSYLIRARKWNRPRRPGAARDGAPRTLIGCPPMP